MRSRGGDQLAALKALHGPLAEGTEPMLRARLVVAPELIGGNASRKYLEVERE
ncbi:hypothetical protein [Aquabacterium sp.]|uniref:hypothetical protein n=1 Tax=Aquabacterium sp. TaxID=1872578 RepID=UPI002B50D84C|nr:hypothetical protein [Aquabacterium sp.]HSW08028.1 hypothetical protein [Aquabacterium sp.]